MVVCLESCTVEGNPERTEVEGIPSLVADKQNLAYHVAVCTRSLRQVKVAF